MQRSLSLELAQGKIESNVNFKIHPITHLIDVLSSEPFNGTKNPPIVICDLDGVVFRSFKSYENFSSLRALARIARLSNSMTIWSARLVLLNSFNPLIKKIHSKQITPFPFISKESIAKLSNLIKKYAPNTKLIIKIGPSKLFNGNLAALLENQVDLKRPIVIIGSSCFDRLAAQKLAEQKPDLLKRLWVFDTGKIII